MASDRFVSRGGEKLQAAIENWKLKIENYVVLDVGSSTGGFVDCLLQNGAKKVYAVDTAYGELAWKLRNDPRVVVMERTNILHLESLPEQMDLVTIDAGWTKLELILPKVKNFLKNLRSSSQDLATASCLKPEGEIVALLKPQYEADQRILIKGVVPKDLVEQVKDEVIGQIKNLGFKVVDQMESPILGGGGNQEFLLYLR